MYLVWEEENFIFSYLFTFALYLTLELLYKKKNLCRIESFHKQWDISESTGNAFPKQSLIAGQQSVCEKIFLTLCHLPEALLLPLALDIVFILSLSPYHTFSVVPLPTESFNYLLSQTSINKFLVFLIWLQCLVKALFHLLSLTHTVSSLLNHLSRLWCCFWVQCLDTSTS